MMKILSLKLRRKGCTVLTFLFIAAFYLKHGCPIRFFIGISCPGCGMSRALEALLRLDFPLALEMHPLVFLLPVAVLVYFTRKLIPKKFLRLLYAFALILLITVYIARMTQNAAVVYADFESGMLFKLFNKLNI